ncbi:MAG: hypothetical protein K0R71_1844 [Bacillales bacterium]|jgi:hypothetical protein|nr:hypothetical protein [Bacillales bacterium]
MTRRVSKSKNVIELENCYSKGMSVNGRDMC